MRPFKKEDYNTVMVNAVLFFFFIPFLFGCHEADTIVLPLTHTVEELNATAESIASELPVNEVLPDAEMHFKGRKLMIEKRF